MDEIKRPSKRIQTASSLSATRVEIPKLHVICTDLLPNILKGVETVDLIKFRVVSKSWKIYIDRILMKREDHKLIFEFSGAVNANKHKNQKCSFVLRSKKEGEQKTSNPGANEKKTQTVVKDLALFLSLFSASSFPCFRVGFLGGKFDHEDVQVFFSKYSSRIKHLCLDWYGDGNVSREEFPENWTVRQTLVQLILRNNLSHLESLEIHGHFHFDMESEMDIGTCNPNSNLGLKNDSLSSLNTLRIKTYNDVETRLVIQSVIPVAPNLCKIVLPTNIDPREIFPFFTAREIELFSFLGLNTDLFSPSFSIEMLELADRLCCASGLQNLGVEMTNAPKNRGITQRTLISTQNLLLKSLESLKSIRISLASFIFMMNAILQNPELLEFHPFTNVKLLQFNAHEESVHEIFPIEYFPLKLQQEIKSSLSLAKVFPCLDVVVIPVVTANMEHCFPFTGEKLESVKILDIASLARNQSSYAKNILKMFPNVEQLRLWGIFDFPAVAECIWKMKRLKHLDLLIHIGSDIEEHQFPQLDAAFTGFSHETADFILEGNLQVVNQFDITMEMKENPSILDLKDLRTLELNFRFRAGDVGSYNFISRVTTDFSFRWMQQVEIEIKIEPPNYRGSWDENSFAPASLDNVTVKIE